MEDVTKQLLKSADAGFALAEYSYGDYDEPVKLTYVDQCQANFLQREAQHTSRPAAHRQRRQPSAAQEPQHTSLRSSRRRSN
jgi:hypothetical protein